MTMAEPLTVTMNEATHRFEAYLDGETAFTEYVIHNGSMVLPHTVVLPAFEGKGVGSLLAKAALGYARAHGLTVKPSCPFIAGYIVKHPEWQDLVHPSFREKLGLPA
jgi:predicted GNAT family acetyltransferase